MKFKKSFLRSARRFFLVVALVSLVIFLIISLLRNQTSSSFFSTRCVDYKQKDFSRRLNDKIVDYSAAAKLRGIKVCKDDSDLKSRIDEGKLVKVKSCSNYVVEKMSFSYPYLTGDSQALLDEIARRLSDKASQKGLSGVKLYITSMTRKTNDVKNLRKYNGNASANSPHMYGNAFDISYKRFIAHKWILTECDKRFLKDALSEVIFQLKNERKCWATYEKIQNCFHVVAR